MITLQQSILMRRSRRTFLRDALSDAHTSAIQQHIDSLNQLSGLRMTFVPDARAAFRSPAAQVLFHGVQVCIAMVGPADDPALEEKVGYYGEKLVLECTRLNLGTCWVAGTYRRDALKLSLQPGERLVCVVAVGYVSLHPSAREAAIYRTLHRAVKPMDQMYQSEATPPFWFLEGMRAVSLAPSAMNRHPAFFTYRDGQAFVKTPGSTPMERLDLGIAQAHFEIGSGHASSRA